MRIYILTLLVSVIVIDYQLSAQNIDLCIDDINYSLTDGTELTPQEINCIDIEDVLANCSSIYIKVNVTFFLNDDCEGELSMDNGHSINASPENAFKIAEDLINAANDFYETVNANMNTNWGNETFLDPPTPATFQCIPIRYVLSGVKIECNSDWQTLTGFINSYETYLDNANAELNLFITHLDFHPSDPDKNGPDGFANRPMSLLVIEDLSAGLFNHETSHLFALEHTFDTGPYFCDDLWDTSFIWQNCAGDITNIPSCWDNLPGDNGSFCDEEYDSCPHPCCEWENQTNNLMAYSAWGNNPEHSALTPCQVESMLERINNRFCDYIEDSDCESGPPRANIGIVPGDGEQVGDCLYCVHLEASMNDSNYDLKISRGGIPSYQTGMVNGPAGVHCFSLRNDPLSNCTEMEISDDILIELTVVNECGESHSETLEFTLPDSKSECDQDASFSFQITPNPVSNYLDLNFDIPFQGHLKLDLVNIMSLEKRNLIDRTYSSDGNYSESFNINSELHGSYYLIARFEDQTCIEQIIKQ